MASSRTVMRACNNAWALLWKVFPAEGAWRVDEEINARGAKRFTTLGHGEKHAADAAR